MKLRLLLLLLVFSCFIFAQPHPVYVEIRNSSNEIPEEDDIHFEAWLLSNPDEILTEDTTDCYYPAFVSFVKINCGQFEDYFAGDILHLEVWELSSNEWGYGEYELNNEASQFFMIDEGGIILMEELPAPEVDLPESFTTMEDDMLTVDFSEYITNTCFFLNMGSSENIQAEINGTLVTIIPDQNWYGFENLQFTARGWGGVEDSSEVMFWVQPINDAPVIYDLEPEASVIELIAGEELLFVVAVIDVDSEIDYLWQINGSQVGRNRSSYLHIFDESGEFEVSLTVSDNEFDQEANWTINVEQNNNEQSALSSEPAMFLGNYPNPFNPETTIRYAWETEINNPQLEIFNLKGQKIETINLQENRSAYTWNGSEKASGIYFYRIAGDHYATQPKSMILLK